jgi:tetratricopeptide (TPR) repeat protein
MSADFGEFDQAMDLLRRANDVAQGTSLPYSQAYFRYGACVVNWLRGEFEMAIKEGEEGIRICDANGIRMFRIWISMQLAMAYAHVGRTTEAIALFEERLPQFGPMGIVFGRLIALPMLSEVYFLNDDPDAALKTANEAIQLQNDKKTDLHRPRTLAILGRIHTHADYYDPYKAERCLSDALEGAEKQGSRVLIAHSRAGLGRLKLSIGNTTEATTELHHACEMYRDMAMIYYLRKAEQDLAAIG